MTKRKIGNRDNKVICTHDTSRWKSLGLRVDGSEMFYCLDCKRTESGTRRILSREEVKRKK